MFKSKEQELIEKLPSDNKERNEWLVKNGVGEEVEQLKVERVLTDTSSSLAEKLNDIMNIFRPKNIVSPMQHPHNPPQPRPRRDGDGW